MSLESVIKHLDAQKCGLHVLTDEELAAIKQKEMEILDYVQQVCKTNGILWGMSGGSALGAVRHKGFIPWDDDIDICMTRENYNRFREAVNNDPQTRFRLFSPGDEGYLCHFPKIFDTNTEMVLIQSTGIAQGVFVDIFILENAPDGKIRRLIHGLECTAYLLVISCSVVNRQKEDLYRFGDAELTRKVKLRAGLSVFFRFMKAERWIAIADRCFSKIKNNQTKDVVAPSGGRHYFGEIWPRQVMCEYREMPFEDRIYPVIKGTDHYLLYRFGPNYMEIPPERDRERHAFVKLNLEGNNKTDRQ